MRLVSSDKKSLPYETTNAIMHLLEQACRGYITGANNCRWNKNVLAHSRKRDRNLVNYYYRFNYQKRDTPHVHMLVWLKTCKYLDQKRFSATVPDDNAWLAHQIRKLQGLL